MPKMSVIVPVFNREKLITKCINSILNQSFKDYEIIIVDDGSSDSSIKIIKEIAHKHPNIKIFCQQNSGVSIARNRGIKESIGEYLIFIDSDDTLSDNALKLLYDNAVNSKADFVYGDFYLRDEIKKLNILRKSKHLDGSSKDIINLYLNQRIEPRIGSFIINKKVLEANKIEFFPKCKYGEDEEFIIKCIIYSSKIEYVNKPIYNYFIHDGSTVKKADISFFHCVEALIRSKEILKSKYYNDEKIIFSINYFILEHFKYCIFTMACNGLKYSEIRKYLMKQNYYSYLSDICKYDKKITFKKRLLIKFTRLFFYYILLKNKIVGYYRTIFYVARREGL